MANPFYTRSFNSAAGILARVVTLISEFTRIEQAFDLVNTNAMTLGNYFTVVKITSTAGRTLGLADDMRLLWKAGGGSSPAWTIPTDSTAAHRVGAQIAVKLTPGQFVTFTIPTGVTVEYEGYGADAVVAGPDTRAVSGGIHMLRKLEANRWSLSKAA